jgi:hypothetical protein
MAACEATAYRRRKDLELMAPPAGTATGIAGSGSGRAGTIMGLSIATTGAGALPAAV